MNRLPFVRRLAPSSLLMAVLTLAIGWRMVATAAPAESDGVVAARETALELAGSFTNDGYKLRDGHWSGQLQPHAAQVVTVNLYAGNQYYFSLGATDKSKKLAVTVYDETGHQVGDEQFFQEKNRAAAGVSLVASGPYYVSVELLDGDPTDFCLVYSYK